MDSLFDKVKTGFQSKFNYNGYSNLKAEMTFYHVDWDRDYSNVVMFDSKKQREAFLETIKDDVVYQDITPVLKGIEIFDANTGRNKGSIRVELPYNNAVGMNYMRIRLPKLPIHGADNQPRRNEYFFFIAGYNSISPNCTEYQIELDIWQTNVFDMRVDSMLLERGHYACVQTKPEDFLDNPLDNTQWVSTPESNITLSDSKYNSYSEWLSTQDDKGYTLVFSSVNWENTNQPPVSGANATPMANLPASSGELGAGLATTRNDYLTSLSGSASGYNTGIRNIGFSQGTYVYAIDCDDFAVLYPQLTAVQLSSIQALALVPNKFISLGNTFDISGITIYNILEQDSSLLDLTLTKDMFDYSDEAKDYTKIYTSPFAHLRISDLDKECIVDIQDISHLKIATKGILQYPFLRISAFLDGIQGSGNNSYSYYVGSTGKSGSIPNGLWNNITFDINVPMFGIYNNSLLLTQERVRAVNEVKEQVNELVLNHTIQEIEAMRRSGLGNSLATEITTERSINNTYSNSERTSSNTKTTSDNSSNTNYTNSLASNATQKSTSDASSNTSKSNAIMIADVNRDNAHLLNQLQYDNTQLQLQASNQKNDNQKQHINNDRDSQIQNNQNNAGLDTASVALNMALEASKMAASGGGDITKPANIGIGVGAAAAYIAGSGMILAGRLANNNQLISTSAYNSTQNIDADEIVDNNYISNTSTATLNTNNNTSNNLHDVQVATYNAQNATELSNNAQVKSTGDANANRTHNTELSNNTLNRNTDNANNTDQKNVDIANKNTTRAQSNDTANANAEVSYSKLYQSIMKDRAGQIQSILQGASIAPTSTTALRPEIRNANMFEQYTGLSGLQVQVMKPTKADEKRVITQFCRYGYELGQFVYLGAKPEWNLMTHYTYWKAQDLWLLGDAMTEPAQDTMRDAFKNGVTVWRDPNEIGKVNIYENQPIYR